MREQHVFKITLNDLVLLEFELKDTKRWDFEIHRERVN